MHLSLSFTHKFGSPGEGHKLLFIVAHVLHCFTSHRNSDQSAWEGFFDLPLHVVVGNINIPVVPWRNGPIEQQRCSLHQATQLHSGETIFHQSLSIAFSAYTSFEDEGERGCSKLWQWDRMLLYEIHQTDSITARETNRQTGPKRHDWNDNGGIIIIISTNNRFRSPTTLSPTRCHRLLVVRLGMTHSHYHPPRFQDSISMILIFNSALARQFVATTEQEKQHSCLLLLLEKAMRLYQLSYKLLTDLSTVGSTCSEGKGQDGSCNEVMDPHICTLPGTMSIYDSPQRNVTKWFHRRVQ